MALRVSWCACAWPQVSRFCGFCYASGRAARLPAGALCTCAQAVVAARPPFMKWWFCVLWWSICLLWWWCSVLWPFEGPKNPSAAHPEGAECTGHTAPVPLQEFGSSAGQPKYAWLQAGEQKYTGWSRRAAFEEHVTDTGAHDALDGRASPPCAAAAVSAGCASMSPHGDGGMAAQHRPDFTAGKTQASLWLRARCC